MIVGFLLVCILGSVYCQTISQTLLDSASKCGLKRHNEYRSVHIDKKTTPIRTTPPLVINSTLTQIAQKYAGILAKQTAVNLTHSGTKGLGENLYVYMRSNSISNAFINSSGVAASKLWYDEIIKYNYSKPGTKTNPGTGHFTQLVWTNSTQVGFGFALGNQSSQGKNWYVLYVVANYYPAGNMFYGNNYDPRYFIQSVLPNQTSLTTLPAY